jgi:hypothetical protein
MSFKYKVTELDGTPVATAILVGTPTAEELCGQIFIKTLDMQSDALFTDQWCLSDINVLPMRNGNGGQGYTGKGVKIAQFEPGMSFSTKPDVFNGRHPDLQATVDPNGNILPAFSKHATRVAGARVKSGKQFCRSLRSVT